jgi:hypothetical protein
MPGQHKHNPLRFRPPGDVREWLDKRQAETGEPMNAILTAAVRALMALSDYRAKTSGTARETKEQDRWGQ